MCMTKQQQIPEPGSSWPAARKSNSWKLERLGLGEMFRSTAHSDTRLSSLIATKSTST